MNLKHHLAIPEREKVPADICHNLNSGDLNFSTVSHRQLNMFFVVVVFCAQQSQDKDANGESGQDVEAAGEEGGKGRSHGYSGTQGGAGDRDQVVGKIQQPQQQK